MIKKYLLEKYPSAVLKKVFFKEYNYLVVHDKKEYHIKVLNVNKNTILSINSKYVWEITKGKVSGIRFSTISKTLIDMRVFNKFTNKIIIFKSTPYKILKIVNESEVIDISDTTQIFDINIYHSINEIIL